MCSSLRLADPWTNFTACTGRKSVANCHGEIPEEREPLRLLHL